MGTALGAAGTGTHQDGGPSEHQDSDPSGHQAMPRAVGGCLRDASSCLTPTRLQWPPGSVKVFPC